jgi:hypothetical protein
MNTIQTANPVQELAVAKQHFQKANTLEYAMALMTQTTFLQLLKGEGECEGETSNHDAFRSDQGSSDSFVVGVSVQNDPKITNNIGSVSVRHLALRKPCKK